MPGENRLIIRNSPSVNHAQLLANERSFPDAAVYGIISKTTYKHNNRYLWQIVPYYSDAVEYDDDMPEFLDREDANSDVDDAIQAVTE